MPRASVAALRRTFQVPVAALLLTGWAVAIEAAVTATPTRVQVTPGNTSPLITVTVTYAPIPVTTGTSGTGTVAITGLPAGAATIPASVTYTYRSGTSSAVTRFQISTKAVTPPGTYPITLDDRTLKAGSTAVTLTVTSPDSPPPGPGPGPQAAAPVVTAVTPASLAAGTPTTPVRIIGRNFDLNAQIAVDTRGIQVLGARIVSSTLAEITLAVRDDTTPGPREIRVVNPDGQETRPPGRLIVRPASALGGTLSVARLAIQFPQPGAFIGLADRLQAKGLLVVTGTGTVIGSWLLDGVPFDRFSLYATAGAPLHLTSQVPIPPLLAGEHRLELRVDNPQQLSSGPLTLVGVAESRSALRLLAPDNGARLAHASPPTFRWTLVPGATGYEVEIDEPDVAEREPRRFRATGARFTPDQGTWAEIGAGVRRWLVRPVFLDETRGEPSPARSFTLLPAAVQVGEITGFANHATGLPAVHWSGGAHGVVYRIELFDAGAFEPAFRALTRDTAYDFLEQAGYGEGRAGVRVTALGADGETLGDSMIVATRIAAGTRRWQVEPAVAGAVPTLTAFAPPEGAMLGDASPTIEAQWTGTVAPLRRALTVDGVDVTQMATWAATSVRYASAVPLSPGPHTVTLTLGATTKSWSFTVVEASSDQEVGAGAATEAGAASPAVPNWGLAAQATLTRWKLPEGAAASAAAGGPALPPGNVGRVQAGLQADVIRGTATGAATGDFAARHQWDEPPLEVQENRNWLATGSTQRGLVSASAKLGLGSPGFADQAEILNTGLPRTGLEGSLGAGGLKLSGYQSLDWDTQTVGGAQSLGQTVRGASLSLEPEGGRALLRASLIDVNSKAGPLTTGGTGTLKGLFGRVFLGSALTLVAEAAQGSFTPAADQAPLDMDSAEWAGGIAPAENERNGKAWRVSLMGSAKLFNYALNVRQTESTFSNPANPGFTMGGVGNLRSADLALSQGFKGGSGMIALNLRHTDSAVAADEGAPKLNNDGGDLMLTLGGGRRVTLTVVGNAALRHGDAYNALGLPETDARDLGGSLTLAQTTGTLMLSQMFSYQRTDDQINAYGNNRSATGMLSANGMVGTHLILSAVGTVMRSEGDPALGKTDVLMASAQPTIQVQRLRVTLQPALSYSRSRNTVLGTDLTTEQYGGLLTWSPAWVRSLLVLQAQADWSRLKNPTALDPPSELGLNRRLAAALTLRWSLGRGAQLAPGVGAPPPLPIGVTPPPGTLAHAASGPFGITTIP